MAHTSAAAQQRQLTRRGVLWLGLRCDVQCKFCYDEHLAQADKIWISVDEAARALDKFRYFYQNTFVDRVSSYSLLSVICADGRYCGLSV